MPHGFGMGEVKVATMIAPVAQLDKAPDYESGDWGFKSLRGYHIVFATRHTLDYCNAGNKKVFFLVGRGMLRGRKKKIKYTRRGSNSGFPACEAGVITN